MDASKTPIAKVVQISAMRLKSFCSIPNAFQIGTVQPQMFRWRSNISASINPISQVSAIGQAILIM